MFREFLGGGLILESNGDKWRHDRNALKPAFTFHRLGELASTTIDRAQILGDRIATAALPAGDAQSSPQSAVRGVVDLEHEFLNLTFDMACCIAYGLGCLRAAWTATVLITCALFLVVCARLTGQVRP